jgi:signal transduction histidine kinase
MQEALSTIEDIVSPLNTMGGTVTTTGDEINQLGDDLKSLKFNVSDAQAALAASDEKLQRLSERLADGTVTLGKYNQANLENLELEKALAVAMGAQPEAIQAIDEQFF